MKSSFSLYEQKLTNEKVTITYKPNTTVTSYSYKIVKDNQLLDEVKVSTSSSSRIVFDESGSYQIEVTLKHKNGTTSTEKSGIYTLDIESPKIILSEDYIEYTENKIFDISSLRGSVRVYDPEEGDLFESLTCDTKNVDFTTLGPAKITCTVSDSAGNTSEKEIILRIVEDHSAQLNLLLGSLGLILLIAFFYLLRFLRATHLEKKISVYATESLHDDRISISEKITSIFYHWIERINHIVEKSAFLEKYSKKYDKYIPLYSSHYQKGYDFVSTKILVAFIFVVISILAKIIQYKLITGYELVLPFIFGFFLPDVIYIIQYKIYKNRLENDLLQAIIIMNNAFKSGRSITQAIELVTKELDGPVGLEFKKMHMEISFGLTVEEVFKRLADRIELEEVTYLTASLSILNKTGGNIIKVFSSIEKTLFNKKKLKLELASLTGSSKIIMYVLFFVPFFFIIFIGLVSPSYFSPFYTTTIGRVLMAIIIVIYLAYIWIVRKVMKVRM